MIKIQNKKYGGGRRDLKTSLPLDLQYLYKNDYFDAVKFMLVLNNFKRRKKGMQMEEANFYFSLIDAVEVGYEEIVINKQYLQNVYLNNEIILKNLVLRLANSGYVEVEIEKTLNKTNLYLTLSELGNQVIAEITHSIFDEIREKLRLICTNFKYKSENSLEVLLKDGHEF